jgi:D-3-phosphoglycerate dehydrogenase
MTMTTQPKILLAHDANVRRNYFRDGAVEALGRLGQLRLNDSGAEWTTTQLIEAAQGCEVLVAYRETPGDAALFDALPDLKAYVRCAVDIRNIDLAAASRNGVLVTHVGGVFVSGVAEWTIAAMIDLNRNLSGAIAAYRAGQAPVAQIGPELRGATLGLIGYGRIGRYLCDLALAFGMRVLVADPFVRVDHAGVQPCELAQLLAEADHVVCLAVANAQTENLMDEKAFALMKPSAFFINPSRGNLVDEAALLAALQAGRIAGCALDVGRAPDQLPSPQLTAHPRVIATPHVAGLTPALDGQSAEAISQVGEILAGRIPAGALNAEQARRIGGLGGLGSKTLR